MTEHAPSDDPQIVGYLSGELDEADRLRFEQRLAAEPELAARLERLEALDLVGATLSGARRDPIARAHRAPWRAVWPFALAVAAAALLVFCAVPATAVECRARAVPTVGVDDVASYAASLDLPDDMRVPVGETRSAKPGARLVPVPEFLAAVADKERERGTAALAAPVERVVAEFVTLRFHADRECSAIVLALDSSGVLRRRYPSPSGVFVFGEAANRFAPHVQHVLPRPVALPSANGAVSLHGGFDVPSDLAVLTTWLVLAVRTEAVTPEVLVELDGALAAQPPSLGSLQGLSAAEQEAAADRALARVLAWLHDRRFTMQRVVVIGG